MTVHLASDSTYRVQRQALEFLNLVLDQIPLPYFEHLSQVVFDHLAADESFRIFGLSILSRLKTLAADQPLRVTERDDFADFLDQTIMETDDPQVCSMCELLRSQMMG
jgi:hypothetical protein